MPGLTIGKDDLQRLGYFSNVFNPGQPVRLRRFFLLEFELDLIAGKLSDLKPLGDLLVLGRVAFLTIGIFKYFSLNNWKTYRSLSDFCSLLTFKVADFCRHFLLRPVRALGIFLASYPLVISFSQMGEEAAYDHTRV